MPILTRRRAVQTIAAAGLLTLRSRAQTSRPMILVGSKQARTLAMVDAGTLEVVARIPIPEDPHEVVIGPDGRTAWVSHLGDGRMHILSRIDLVHRRALSAFDTRPLEGAHGLFAHGDSMWFTAVGSKAIARIDTGPEASLRIAQVLGTGQDNSHMMWVSRDGRTMLVANAGAATMSLFRLDEPRVNTGAATPYAPNPAPDWSVHLLPAGQKAEGFAVKPDETEAWVGNDDGSITVLDLVAGKLRSTFIADIPGANRLRFTPDGRRLIATTHTGPELAVFDAATRQLIRRVPIEQHGASGIAIEANGNRAFIACPRDHFVAVVDLARLERTSTIDVGREPDGIVWWPGV